MRRQAPAGSAAKSAPGSAASWPLRPENPIDGIDIQLRVAGFQYLFRRPCVRLRYAVAFCATSKPIGWFDDPHIRPPSRRIEPGECPDLRNVEHQRRPPFSVVLLYCCTVVLVFCSAIFMPFSLYVYGHEALGDGGN
jgi:hypothetical protein